MLRCPTLPRKGVILKIAVWTKTATTVSFRPKDPLLLSMMTMNTSKASVKLSRRTVIRLKSWWRAAFSKSLANQQELVKRASWVTVFTEARPFQDLLDLIVKSSSNQDLRQEAKIAEKSIRLSYPHQKCKESIWMRNNTWLMQKSWASWSSLRRKSTNMASILQLSKLKWRDEKSTSRTMIYS